MKSIVPAVKLAEIAPSSVLADLITAGTDFADLIATFECMTAKPP